MPQPTGLFDGTVSLLQRTLNLRSAQHQAMSSNITNADTPNHRAFEFAEEEDDEQPHKRRARHLQSNLLAP